ncbi:MAG TPA: MBL fold metallo-hydrolase [Candidatus Paceibacterota bacterium]|nr:MBL fold metallo-hydrolase [Candidatus Paceibacterota bacterium]
MKITKYAHSCLLLEIDNVKILTDLGSWNPDVPEVSDLNAILITHEHADHFDVEKLKSLVAKNPEAKLITHAAVGAKLQEAGMEYTPIESGERIDVSGVSIESCGTDHAVIYGTTSPCRNTGYLIADTFYIPGDALHDTPSKQIEILALPTGGPWMKVAEAIGYAKSLKPKVVIPIHDAMYTEEVRATSIPRWIGAPIEEAGIKFVNMENNSSEEF